MSPPEWTSTRSWPLRRSSRTEKALAVLVVCFQVNPDAQALFLCHCKMSTDNMRCRFRLLRAVRLIALVGHESWMRLVIRYGLKAPVHTGIRAEGLNDRD
jgi:hypothetical protein